MIHGPLLFVRGQFRYESRVSFVKMHAYLHHSISRPTEGAGHSRPETSVNTAACILTRLLMPALLHTMENHCTSRSWLNANGIGLIATASKRLLFKKDGASWKGNMLSIGCIYFAETWYLRCINTLPLGFLDFHGTHRLLSPAALEFAGILSRFINRGVTPDVGSLPSAFD